MAHRIPAVGDTVRARTGYGLDYEGEVGTVVRSEPPRASEHRCTVRWSDGGEEPVESKYLSIVAPASALADTMSAGELQAHLNEAIVSGHEAMPVVVRHEDGDVTRLYRVLGATKQGHAFRIYVEPGEVIE